MGRERANKLEKSTGTRFVPPELKSRLTGPLSGDRYFSVHEELLPSRVR